MSDPPSILPDYSNNQPTVAGVSSINSITGAVTITAGTNISLTPAGNDITINQINVPVLVRGSGSTPLLITATTLATAQTIGTITITTGASYDVDISAVVTFQSGVNADRDINLFATVGGVQVGTVITTTVSNITNYVAMPYQSSALDLTAGPHTIVLKCYCNAASVITMRNYQLRAIGNLD